MQKTKDEEKQAQQAGKTKLWTEKCTHHKVMKLLQKINNCFTLSSRIIVNGK